MEKGNLNVSRRVVLVHWKDRREEAFQVFSNLKIFTATYPVYSYHTLNNYLSKQREAFEDETVKVERKGLITKALVTAQVRGDGFKMERVVKKVAMRDLDEEAENLAYWLSKSPVERLAAAGFIVGQSMKKGERMDKTFVQKRKLKDDDTGKGF
jgi:hypothetical protein